MRPGERRKWIMQEINVNGKVEINALSEKLTVSQMTIHRDLAQLEEEGQVIRTHGGAVLPKPLTTETPFSKKKVRKIDQKRQIAKKALSIVKEQQTIILDSGTTTLELAKLLKTKKNITIITNDIKIAGELIESDLKVIVTGGELQNDVGALYGPQAHHFLENIHVDMFFLGAHAIDMKDGVTSPMLEKSFVKQLMMQSAASTWLIADSSKLNQKSFSKVCDLKDLTGFITDNDLSNEMKTDLAHIIEVL